MADAFICQLTGMYSMKALLQCGPLAFVVFPVSFTSFNPLFFISPECKPLRYPR